MASFTKKAIVYSFLKLCAKKSPDKITVRDIVDDCEINRNTFYYHFQDIYAVVEEVFSVWMTEFNDCMCGDGAAVDIEAALLTVTAWAEENRRAVINLSFAFDGVTIENYLLGASKEGFCAWAKSGDGACENEAAVSYVATTAALGFFTVLRRWLASSMKGDPETLVRRYVEVWLRDPQRLLQGYEGR